MPFAIAARYRKDLPSSPLPPVITLLAIKNNEAMRNVGQYVDCTTNGIGSGVKNPDIMFPKI